MKISRLLAVLTLLALTCGFAGRAAAQRRDQARPQFNDHDRQAVHAWMEHNRARLPLGFRMQDRLPPALESHLQLGAELAPELRRRIHPVPHDLLVTLVPPPPGDRYVVIGDHLCLIDGGFHLLDVLHLELNF